MRSSLHRLVLAAPFGVLGVYAALRVLTSPDARGYGTHEQLGFAPCRLRDLFGGPCPTCGVTTSASHAARGDLLLAWQAQPLGVLILVAALAGAAAATSAHRRGVDLGAVAVRHGRVFWALVAALTLGSWLAIR